MRFLFFHRTPGVPQTPAGLKKPVSLVLLSVIFCTACTGGSPAPGTKQSPSTELSERVDTPERTEAPERAELPERIDLYYFYEELCQSCDGTEEFRAIAEKELSGVRDRYPYAVQTLNVFLAGNRNFYEEMTDAMGLDRETLELPLLIAGGRVLQGNERIADNLREAFLSAGEDLFVYKRVYNPGEKKTGDRLFEDYGIRRDHLSLVYFYRITCEECEKVRPFIDSLPEAIPVDGRELPLDIIRINTRSGNNGERIAAFFDLYRVPDEDRVVPIIFLADTYLAGYEPIVSNLRPLLENPPKINRMESLLPWR
jgi:thiol-disulfide isomerase/thioredoxin